jgi:DNA-directed RNA polymerase specialized sigma24 family protein
MTRREGPVRGKAVPGLDIRVPVRVELRGHAWRVLEKAANERHTTVGQLLAALADKATGWRVPVERKTYVRMTPDRIKRMRELDAQGFSQAQIGAELDVSARTVWQYLKAGR